jgi:hypothetical protein
MMKIEATSALFLILGLGGGMTRRTPRLSVASPRMSDTPALINACLITNDVWTSSPLSAHKSSKSSRTRLEKITLSRTSTAVRALFAATAQEKYIPGAATSSQNHSPILEFRVGTAIRIKQGQNDLVKSWVKGPTSQPGGPRSYFPDPDGNLFDFFAPPAPRQ